MVRCVALALLALSIAAVPAAAAPTKEGPAPRDATVVAVIDSGFNPYHHDWAAATTPGDFPLDRAPQRWLPGFDK